MVVTQGEEATKTLYVSIKEDQKKQALDHNKKVVRKGEQQGLSKDEIQEVLVMEQGE